MNDRKAQKGSERDKPDDGKKRKKSRPRFIDFMRSSPLMGVELDLERDKSSMRGIVRRRG